MKISNLQKQFVGKFLRLQKIETANASFIQMTSLLSYRGLRCCQTYRINTFLFISEFNLQLTSSREHLDRNPSRDYTSSTAAALASAELDYNLSLQERDNDLPSYHTPTTAYSESPHSYQPGINLGGITFN